MWLSHANVFIHRWIMSLPALLRLRGSSTELILAVFGSWIFYCSFVMISLRLEMVWYVLNYIKSAFKRNLDESFVGPGSYWWGQFQGQRLLLCVCFFLIEKIIEKSYKNSSRNWHFNLKIKCEWKEEDFIFLFYLLLSEAACWNWGEFLAQPRLPQARLGELCGKDFSF